MRLLTLRSLLIPSLALSLLHAGCGASDSRWGDLTDKGPRVKGSSLGMQTFYEDDGDAVAGTVYDSDGDGRADEVDLDGDGISDGEDVDGDGIITVWKNLVGGDDTTSADDLDKEFASTPVAVANRFAATAPLPGETASGPSLRSEGGLNLVEGKVPTGKPIPGVLTARPQHQLGSCGAFASSAAVALMRYNREKATNPSVDIDTLWPAPLYIYQYNAKVETTNGKQECSGTNLHNNFNRFLQYGAPAESELPYPEQSKARDPNPSYCTTPAMDAAATSSFREAHRIGGHVGIRSTGVEFRKEVKRQLDMGHPVTFGANLPEGFQEFRSTNRGADGKLTDVTQVFKGGGICTGTHCGGHAMVITGYDDTRAAYRVLNSWGTDWGDNGYIWWDYASLESQGNLHASALMPLPANAPALGPPNAAAVTVNVMPNTTPAYAKLPANASGKAYWAVIARVHWNEPVTVTSVVSNINGNVFTVGLNQSMLDGDLQGYVVGSANAGFDSQSIVGQMATLTITATTRDGMTITRMLPSFTVPAPTM